MVSLDEVKKLISTELYPMKKKIEILEEKFKTIDKSMQFHSNKYDELLKQYQAVNKTINNTTKETNDTKSLINASKKQIMELDKELKNMVKDIDDVKQYLRRDCIEVVGTKARDAEECTKITIALAKDMGIVLEPSDISTAHPLPTPRGKDDKFIVKFTRRETKDKVYSNRKKIAGKKPSNLETVKSIVKTDMKLFISESLTPSRKKLFGAANAARKLLKWKYIWTNNGRIYLKKNEESSTTTIDSDDDFNAFQAKYNIRK